MEEFFKTGNTTETLESFEKKKDTVWKMACGVGISNHFPNLLGFGSV